MVDLSIVPMQIGSHTQGKILSTFARIATERLRFVALVYGIAERGTL